MNILFIHFLFLLLYIFIIFFSFPVYVYYITEKLNRKKYYNNHTNNQTIVVYVRVFGIVISEVQLKGELSAVRISLCKHIVVFAIVALFYFPFCVSFILSNHSYRSSDISDTEVMRDIQGT